MVSTDAADRNNTANCWSARADRFISRVPSEFSALFAELSVDLFFLVPLLLRFTTLSVALLSNLAQQQHSQIAHRAPGCTHTGTGLHTQVPGCTHRGAGLYTHGHQAAHTGALSCIHMGTGAVQGGQGQWSEPD